MCLETKTEEAFDVLQPAYMATCSNGFLIKLLLCKMQPFSMGLAPWANHSAYLRGWLC